MTLKIPKSPKEDIMDKWEEDIRKASDRILMSEFRKIEGDDEHTIYPIGPYMKKVK